MLIGVDHGNKQIKTVHCSPFVSGLQQSITKPFGQSLQYRAITTRSPVSASRSARTRRKMTASLYLR